MISILIDTSLSYIRLALFKDNTLIDSINEYCTKDLSVLFDLRVRDILTRNNIEFKNIDKIYAVTGPGSFTGIRIGLTFAKVLGMSLKKDIVPISELEVLSSTEISSNKVAPLIDARRGYVYAGIYDKNLNNIYSDKYILLEEFLKNIDNDVTFVSYNNFDGIKVTCPDINFEKIINLVGNRKPINYHVISPNYLKATEAEENLKKKQLNDTNL